MTAYEAFEALQRAGVAAAPYLDEASFSTDPQVEAREWIRPLPSTDVGDFGHLGHAFRGIPLAWERGAPLLGQDNEYVFKDILGLSDDEYRPTGRRADRHRGLPRSGRQPLLGPPPIRPQTEGRGHARLSSMARRTSMANPSGSVRWAW